MTPDEADSLLDWFAGADRRRHRYVLEGGTRQRWDCPDCGCATEASSSVEATDNLAEYGHFDPRAAKCAHANVRPSGHYMPPMDFS